MSSYRVVYGAPRPVSAAPQGQTGLTGPVGPQGSQGPVGPPGALGPVGPVGAQGSSGPMGPAGQQGPVGPQGPAGARGLQGDVGPVGPQGPVGPSGVASGPTWRVTTLGGHEVYNRLQPTGPLPFEVKWTLWPNVVDAPIFVGSINAVWNITASAFHAAPWVNVDTSAMPLYTVISVHWNGSFGVSYRAPAISVLSLGGVRVV